MKLRPYDNEKDFENIKNWVTDERTHAMWSANRFVYPLDKDNFGEFLSFEEEKYGNKAFLALENGKAVGFFCYTLNNLTKEGLFKFIVVNPEHRGKGIAVEMLRLAREYAFNETKADAVQLMVFTDNIRAKKCYEKAGFVERSTTEDAFTYKDESWGRCNMVYRRN